MNRIVFHLPELIVDKSANYFCSKLFKMLSYQDKSLFIAQIINNFVPISQSQYGTFTIQTILESISEQDLIIVLVDCITANLTDLIFDPNGVYIVCKVISLLNIEYSSCLISILLSNFIQICLNRNGIKAAIEIIRINDANLIRIIESLINTNFDLIVNHESGNQAIQYAIKTWSYSNSKSIIKRFYGKFNIFSVLKYSSNIVETILNLNHPKAISNFTMDIKKNKSILNLITHAYGNYVIQRMLTLPMSKDKKIIINLLINNIDKIIEPKLRSKWQSILKQCKEKDKLADFSSQETLTYTMNMNKVSYDSTL